MKHYFNPISRGVTTDWMLTELEAEHERIVIDVAQGDNDSPDFRAINPMRKLPVLVEGEVVVTEVAAICAYLADKFPHRHLSPDIATADRGSYYRYLFLAGNTIEPALTLAASNMVHPEPKSVGWGDLERVVATIETLTPSTDWALGKRFSAADVVFGGLLDFSINFHWINASAKVADYVGRLRARPAYQQTHDAFNAMLAATSIPD